MSEVLDQSEIDALLNAVKSPDEGEGESAAPAAAVAETPAAAAPTGGERPIRFTDIEAHIYDFKRPERVSKDQIRVISSIHEVFARNLGATLSGMLRTIIDVRVVGVEQLTYNEFIHSLPNPTCFMVLKAPPLEGQMCMEISPLIVYPFVDRMLGGDSNSTYIPQRPLTSIEWRLIDRIVERALGHLSEVWHNLVDARFEVVEHESNPQLVHIVAPSEVVVFITFEIKLSHTAGTMSLCIPFNTIESVLTHLTSQSWFYKPKPATEVQQRRLIRNLVKSPLKMTAFLGRSRIRLSDLKNLQVGDIIEIEKRVGEDMILQVAGRNKFAGRPGQVRGHRALRITRRAEIDELL